MTRRIDGDFSNSLLSIQLQLSTLFEDAGGDKAVHLMDGLAQLTKTEQQVVLNAFVGVVEKIVSGTLRVESSQDAELKDFESKLYEGVLACLKDVAKHSTAKKLTVVDGGKRRAANKVENLFKKPRERRDTIH